jgi:hypothetical protein
MNVCKDINRFSRTNETVADLFSLLAVALLFASIWVTLEYAQPVLAWLDGGFFVRAPLLAVGLALNAFAIIALLAVGSARFGQDDERCFGTFRGRRGQHGARGVLTSWIAHIENVGKKHR